MAKKRNEDEERYQLTPKGIANLSMRQTGIISDLDDPRFEGFWKIFVDGMNQGGYIKNDDEDSDSNEQQELIDSLIGYIIVAIDDSTEAIDALISCGLPEDKLSDYFYENEISLWKNGEEADE